MSGITSQRVDAAMIGITTAPKIEIGANDGKLTIGSAAGTSRFDGNVNFYGKINPARTTSSGTSDDGVWIQCSSHVGPQVQALFRCHPAAAVRPARRVDVQLLCPRRRVGVGLTRKGREAWRTQTRSSGISGCKSRS